MKPIKILRASSAERWANCPGSTVLSQIPQEDTLASKEGTLCHLLVHLLARGEIVSSDPINIINSNSTFIKENKTGLFITQEHKVLALEAFEYCMSVWENYLASSFENPLNLGLWEQKVVGGILPPGVQGTADFICHDTSTNTLHVIDLKFGFKSIEAIRNKQLLIYSIGAIDILKTSVTEVHLHIFQPRDFTGEVKKVWKLKYSNWKNEIQKLNKATHDAQIGNSLQTGSHCQFCPSRIFCKAFLNSTSGMLNSIFYNPEDTNLSIKALGKGLEYLKHAETSIVAARKAFEDRITSEIEKGQPIPGWQIGNTPGRKKWTANISEVKAVAKLLDIKLTKENLVSIGEAWKHKIARPILDTLIAKSNGSKKLIPFNKTQIKENFSDNR